MKDCLAFEVDGVMVRETDLSQFRTEPALRQWRKRVLNSYRLNENDRLDAMYELDTLTKQTIDKMRAAAKAREGNCPPRNLDLVVIPQNAGRVAECNWSMGNKTAAEVGKLLSVFDRAEQMGSYEFDAYVTLGDDECERQGIETLYDLFGTDWATAFYRHKAYLIARLDLTILRNKRADLSNEINRAEAELEKIEAAMGKN